MEGEEGKKEEEQHPLLLIQSWLEKTNVGPILSPLTNPLNITSYLATSSASNSNGTRKDEELFFEEDDFEKYSISSLRRRISKWNTSFFLQPSSLRSDSHQNEPLSPMLSSPSIELVSEKMEKEEETPISKIKTPSKSTSSVIKSPLIVLPPKVKRSTTQLLPIDNNGIKKQKIDIVEEKDKEGHKEGIKEKEKAIEMEKDSQKRNEDRTKAQKQMKENEKKEIEKGSPLDDLESENMILSPIKSLKSNVLQNSVHPTMEPQKYSILSPEEHIQYLNLQKKISVAQQKQIPLEGITSTEIQLYDYLTSFITNEQQRWREWITHVKLSDKSLVEKIKHVNPIIEMELKDYYERKRNQLKEYPAHWNIQSVFDLRTIQVAASDPVLKHKQTVLQKGKCLHFQPPPKNSGLPQSLDENQSHWSKKYFPSVSRDKDVFKLLERTKANFVISSSTLQSLVDPQEAFEIPVRIINIPQGGQQKVVFLDKPLLPKKTTPKERNTSHYNIAFKAKGLQSPTNGAPIDFDAKIDDHLKEQVFESENQTYNLWQFGNYSVLIRCKIHGKIADNNKIQFRYVGLRTKMEYQLNEGLEEMTMRETARSWIYTFIRPDAHLLLGRIDPENGRVVEVEHKDMPSILPTGCVFKPEVPSKFIFSVFQQLDQLVEGQYLISHKLNEFNVIIYRSVSSSESKPICDYDLHLAHKSTPAVDFESIPLCLVKWDMASHPNQIPYTFPLNRVSTPKLTLLCFSFLQKGICEAENCGKIHSNLMQLNSSGLPLLKEKHQFGGRHCHFFASYGFCKQSNCKHPHIPKEILQQQKKRKTGKKKRTKKKTYEETQIGNESNRIEEFPVHSDLVFIANNI
eukprot:TRINITY_DN383_c1_g1_i2.p1 TRINITY_DN383_c1_g1~~TRINITY_DN383_c1_g1_i2.p1  ORF type:complete len:855 (-),score=194.21 TRINITY_DN383_c1_g1_i2:2399-4963(-)